MEFNQSQRGGNRRSFMAHNAREHFLQHGFVPALHVGNVFEYESGFHRVFFVMQSNGRNDDSHGFQGEWWFITAMFRQRFNNRWKP